MRYYDLATKLYFEPIPPRPETIRGLEGYGFIDDAGHTIDWKPGQLEIIDTILHRASPDGLQRIQIIAATQYGKSLAVAAGVVIRAATKPEKWAIVAGTTEKARIIMEYVIMLTLNNELLRNELTPDTSIDRLRMKKSADRLTFRNKGEVRVYSAEAKQVTETSKSLMGFGCIVKGYKVLTDKGEIEISELVKSKITNKVWSFNHATGERELCRIINYQKNPLANRQIYEIDLGNKKIRCTEDHPVWIDNLGYIKARNLKIGNRCMGFGLTNSLVRDKLDVCKLSARYVKQNTTVGPAILIESKDTFVAENVEGSDNEQKKIPIGNLIKFVYGAINNIRIKVKSFVAKSVWDWLFVGKNIIGNLPLVIITTTGEVMMFPIKDSIHGLVESWENQENVSIAEKISYRAKAYIGQTEAVNISEKNQIGSDFVPCVIKNMTVVKPKDQWVYNLEVEKNHNYFIEEVLLHNSPNVIEDEAALVGDVLQATVMRMLGGSEDNFLVKIGNPFTRGHFLKTWTGGKYHRIFIDYQRALHEGRFTNEFIKEMQEEAMFDILYECKFPAADRMDQKGWIPLLTKEEVERAFVDEEPLLGDMRLGNDVAGGGRNYSVSVLRAYNVAKKIYKANEPDTMIFAGEIMTLKKTHLIRPQDVFIDRVGVGKGAYDRLHELDNRIVGVNAGSEADEKSRYLNLRAEMYWRLREWVLRGGKLEKDDDWYQLADVKYKAADSSGRIKIMSKEEMLREGIDSPDVADALALTFSRHDIPPSQADQVAVQATMPPDDPYDQVSFIGQVEDPDPYA